MRSPATLIIGAGPAGLAAAACLRKGGHSFLILEREATVGASWQRHYDRLHLHSEARHSALPYLGFPKGTPRYPSREQMVHYLHRYARHFGLAPLLGEEVRSVGRVGDEWMTSTLKGNSYRSRHVIIATGHNAVPHLPSWPGQDGFRGRIMHSSAYRNGEPFRGQRVLVVGLGNSGGEIALDLHEHGARVAIAVRSAVNIVPRDLLGVPILSISIALSRLPARLADALAAPLLRFTIGDLSRLGFRKPDTGPITQIKASGRVPLIDIGTVNLVRAGHIEVLGSIRSLSETHVDFTDGTSQRFDALVLATGFRPETQRFLQEVEVPGAGALGRERIGGRAGLYFCGFFVSPRGMLRDIATEARWIAQDIGAKGSELPARA
ncbi:MAG TPA: NAD(P)/FAD-dependent oxidoreductase [Steroidobacteraceae bacterium]|nr:NAD(P)/FAD-dependent oxidoreductase [Steroidobacteraceae bacterium]